jgi:hypothetical protein
MTTNPQPLPTRTPGKALRDIKAATKAPSPHQHYTINTGEQSPWDDTWNRPHAFGDD